MTYFFSSSTRPTTVLVLGIVFVAVMPEPEALIPDGPESWTKRITIFGPSKQTLNAR